MIDRLLQKDISRQENFSATITSGTKKEYRYSFNKDGGQEFYGNITDNTFPRWYNNPGVVEVYTTTIYLNLDRTPLVMFWLLDIMEQPAGVPHPVLNPNVPRKAAKLLSGTPTQLITGLSTTVRVYWNKNEIKHVITTGGLGGIGSPTYLARFKFAVYYDDLGLQEQGF